MVYNYTRSPTHALNNLNFKDILLSVEMMFIFERKFIKICILATDEDDFIVDKTWSNYTALLEKSTTALSRRAPWSR